MVEYRVSKDRESLIKILDKWDNETNPSLSSTALGIDGTVDALLKNGEFILRMDGDYVSAICGYTFGQRNENFENKSIGFVGITIIDSKYRGKFFGEFLREVSKIMKSKGVSEMRFASNAEDERINNFYKRFAKDLGIFENSGGFSSRLYSVDLSDIH